jgi:hypothetical protein
MQQFSSEKAKHDALKARLRLRIRLIRRTFERRLEAPAPQAKSDK